MSDNSKMTINRDSASFSSTNRTHLLTGFNTSLRPLTFACTLFVGLGAFLVFSGINGWGGFLIITPLIIVSVFYGVFAFLYWHCLKNNPEALLTEEHLLEMKRMELAIGMASHRKAKNTSVEPIIDANEIEDENPTGGGSQDGQ